MICRKSQTTFDAQSLEAASLTKLKRNDHYTAATEPLNITGVVKGHIIATIASAT